MTPDQLKAARGLLGWSKLQLGLRSDTSMHVVTTFERSGRVALVYRRPDLTNPLAAVRAALEAAGVEFTSEEAPGVRLRGSARGEAAATKSMIPLPPTKLGQAEINQTEINQAEINRGAAVLFYLLTWRDEFSNNEAMRSLREARLDVAVEVTPSGQARVHPAVLKAFHALAGRAAFWDSAGKVWRERRKDDPE